MPATSVKPKTPHASDHATRRGGADSEYSANPEYWSNARTMAPERSGSRSAARSAFNIILRLLVVAVGAAVVTLLARLL